LTFSTRPGSYSTYHSFGGGAYEVLGHRLRKRTECRVGRPDTALPNLGIVRASASTERQGVTAEALVIVDRRTLSPVCPAGMGEGVKRGAEGEEVVVGGDVGMADADSSAWVDDNLLTTSTAVNIVYLAKRE